MPSAEAMERIARRQDEAARLAWLTRGHRVTYNSNSPPLEWNLIDRPRRTEGDRSAILAAARAILYGGA